MYGILVYCKYYDDVVSILLWYARPTISSLSQVSSMYWVASNESLKNYETKSLMKFLPPITHLNTTHTIDY